MAKFIVGLILLIKLLHFIEFGSGEVPCSYYFQYFYDDDTDEVLGLIKIPTPPKYVPLRLTVNLKIAMILPSKYSGRLELARSKKESMQAVMQGKPLVYCVHFPLQNVIPVITRIIFNNQEYCREQELIAPVVTLITLEHTLIPPMIIYIPKNVSLPFLNQPEDQSSLQNSNSVSVPNVVPTWTLTTIPPREKLEIMNQDCGRIRMNNVNYLIAGAKKALVGQWPWLVAIFIMKNEAEFRCSGNLVSNKHILTAAHCFEVNGTEVLANDLRVSLGHYRLRNWKEKDSVNRTVAKYKIYHYNRDSESDLAVITLTEAVTFNSVIQPVCLWSGSVKLEYIIGKTGFVAGWGRDEKGNVHTLEPRVIEVPIVSQEDCLRSNVGFIAITSNRTFCGGARDGSGPCNGDSGSGLVIRNLETGRFYLRGIVSLSLMNEDTGLCDLSQYVVYTDVAQYLDWIREQIAT